MFRCSGRHEQVLVLSHNIGPQPGGIKVLLNPARVHTVPLLQPISIPITLLSPLSYSQCRNAEIPPPADVIFQSLSLSLSLYLFHPLALLLCPGKPSSAAVGTWHPEDCWRRIRLCEVSVPVQYPENCVPVALCWGGRDWVIRARTVFLQNTESHCLPSVRLYPR